MRLIQPIFEGVFALRCAKAPFELLAAKLSAHILRFGPHIHLDIYSKDNIGLMDSSKAR